MTEYIVIPADPGSGSRAGAGIQRNGASALLITRHSSPFLDFGRWTVSILPFTHHSLRITVFQPNEPYELITHHLLPFFDFWTLDVGHWTLDCFYLSTSPVISRTFVMFSLAMTRALSAPSRRISSTTPDASSSRRCCPIGRRTSIRLSNTASFR